MTDRARRELRHAARRLRRAPGFTVTAILTLAVGIGATGAMASLTRAIVLSPLPYPASDRLVAVSHTAPGLGLEEVGQSVGTYLHYRDGSRAFEEIGLYHTAAVNLTGEAEPERVELVIATPSAFSTLGASALLGRPFTEADARPGAATRVVLSYDLWRRRFGGDPGIVGRAVEVNGVPREVAGVMGPDFRFPSPETDLWMNLAPDPARASFGDDGGLFRDAVARLRPGVSPGEAATELRALVPTLAEAYGDVTSEDLRDAGLRPLVTPLKEAVLGEATSTLVLLLCGAGLVMLIAAANASNLLLARAEDRRTETAVRRALGASDRAVLGTFLAESLLLAAGGGAAGALLAAGVARTAPRLDAVDLPRLHEVAFGASDLALVAGLALGIGAVLGIVAVLGGAQHPSPEALREGGRGGIAGPGRRSAARVLVASQVALALLLLVGAALMVRSFDRLRRVDAGFRPVGVLALELALPFRDYPRYEDAEPFYRQLLDRIRALPGVEAAGAASVPPLGGTPFSELREPVRAEGAERGPEPVVHFKLVTPGYFETMGIRVLEGRALRLGEPPPPEGAVLVSRSLARRLFPDGAAIGRRIRRAAADEPAWATVAGVVGDVRHESLRAGPTEIVYVPVLPEAGVVPFVPRLMTVVVRGSAPSAGYVPAIRRHVRELDPRLPIAKVRTMEELLAGETALVRFTMLLLAAAAAVALFLGAVGVYGVVSYAVRRRTREIGVRVALGARAADIVRMVLRHAAALLLPGLAVGAAAALLLTRFLRGMLFEVAATDPWSYAATAALLVAAGLIAAWLPARRAARVDPMLVLRQE